MLGAQNLAEPINSLISANNINDNLKFLESEESSEICTTNEETVFEKFLRISRYFEPSSDVVIDAEAELSVENYMQLYGLGQQAEYGDQRESEPHWTDRIEHMKWEAWEAERGKTREEA